MKVVIIWLIIFLFLQTKPAFPPLFAWSHLDISATSDSVYAVSEGYQLNYCWILKLLRLEPKSKFVPSIFGVNIQTAEFGIITAGTACWDIENSQKF